MPCFAASSFCLHLSSHCGLIVYLTHWPLGDLEKKFRYVIFKLILVNDGWGIFCEIALRWISMNLTDDKSTLVQVMAWCCQARSHYLSQCWPRSLSPYGFTRSQWVKIRNFFCLSISIFASNEYINGLVQACSNSSALTMEILQSCTKPSICFTKLCLHQFRWLLVTCSVPSYYLNHW